MAISWAVSADKHGVPPEDALHATVNACFRRAGFDEPRVPGGMRPDLYIGPPRKLARTVAGGGGPLEALGGDGKGARMRTEQECQAAADWAEQEMDLSRATGGTVHHGAAAAAHGRALLEQAAGGRAELAKVSRGRPSIDPDAGPGEHSRVRQVRLPAAQNEQLDAVAASEGRRPSAVIRDAVAEYLATHRAG